MTQLFGSPGPLDWTAAGERLERIRPRLDEIRREVGAFDARPLLARLASRQRQAHNTDHQNDALHFHFPAAASTARITRSRFPL